MRDIATPNSMPPNAPASTVSTPITWEELANGASTDDFRIDNVPSRIAQVGDLWAPVDAKQGRFDLAPLLQAAR